MTPGARSQTAIELLDNLPAGRAADRFLSGYFRSRRFIGSGDRRDIGDLAFSVFRRRAQLDWWIAEGSAGTIEPDNRARVIANRALVDGWDANAIGAAFDGGKYRPQTLSEGEAGLAGWITSDTRTLDVPGQPRHVRYNYPEWLDPLLERSLGEGLEAEMAALLDTAPVDLRVNRLKGTREDALASLADDGVEATLAPYSPEGLRLPARRTLPTLKAFNSGLIEVQDEGAQIASRLVDARSGHRVVDYCAGAGGKSLAMAAAMGGQGKIFACDTSEARLARLGPRLERSGIVDLIQGSLLDEEGFAETLEVGSFDRVLVDAPCSGIGTWRRNPDAKWRLTPEGLNHEIDRQRNILTKAATLTAPGGRLVYVTCSVLRQENEDQIDWFLGARSDYASIPVGGIWTDTIGGNAPEGDPGLRLSTARHGTDGFFVAILERLK